MLVAMNPNFDLGDMRAFAAVGELQSFRAAADAVHISRPALSRRIDKLEEALGVRLLDRTTRKVALTAVGRDFLRKTQDWLDELDAMMLGLGDVAARRIGEVTIACVPSTVYYFLPLVLKQYHERYPRIRVKVHDASANDVLLAVAQGEADFGLNFIGRQEVEIEFRAVLTERFVAACRRDHVLARKKSVTWDDLGRHDFISVGKSSGNRLLMDLALASSAARPQSLYEAKHVTTLLGMVEAGLGVAAVPSLAMPSEDHPTLVSLPLKDPIVTRQIGLIKRRGKTLSPAAQTMYDLLAASRQRRRRRASY